MARFRNVMIRGLAALTVGLGAAAASPLTVVSSVGGAPTGAVRFNFDDLTLGSGTPQTTTSVVGSTQMQIVLNPNAGVVAGAASGVYAAPVLSGNNGNGFGPGGSNQANGVDTTKYLTTGSTGAFAGASVTLNLPFAAQYFGLLWGSVDTYNTLSFYDAANMLVGSITGSAVTPLATGDQGAEGTFYVNINSTVAFTKVVATSSQYAFEFGNVALASQPIGGDPSQVPAPAGLALFGVALLGLAALRRATA